MILLRETHDLTVSVTMAIIVKSINVQTTTWIETLSNLKNHRQTNSSMASLRPPQHLRATQGQQVGTQPAGHPQKFTDLMIVD